MSERLGIIDVGSNSVRMVIFEHLPHHSFRLIDEVKEAVRLAQGLGDANTLGSAQVERAIETLRMFGSLARALGVERLLAIATSAVRDAANQTSFLARVRDETGLELRVLSGDEEAAYGYLGAVNSLAFSDGFAFDIGGGSLELMQVRGRGLVRGTSLPLGTLRLWDRFLGDERPAKSQLRAIEAHLDAELGALDWFSCAGQMQLVGIGGTARSLARIDQSMRGYPLDKTHGYEIPAERLDALAATLASMTTAERAALDGLSSDRADVILPGALLVRSLLRHSGCRAMLVSGQGLREGLFYEQFLAGARPTLLSDVRAFGVDNLARLYDAGHLHAAKVRDLSLQLFDQLSELHGYGPWERGLLAAAATLHDIGVSVSFYDHHKHSLYLILNSLLPGYSHREIVLIGLLTRFHRKGRVTLEGFASMLADDDEPRVARLSAMLRLAEYLERGKSQVVQSLRCHVRDDAVRIEVQALGNATVEIWDASRRAGLFRKAFGREVEIV